MNLTGNQIKQRKIHDDELFQASLDEIANVINEKSEFFGIGETLGDYSAMADIVRHLGYSFTAPPEEIKDINDQIDYICRPYGIMHRSVILKGKWYRDAIGAYLVRRKSDGALIALLPSFRGYVYKDPDGGTSKAVNAKNAALFSESALVFYKPLPPKKLTPVDLVRYSFSCRSIQDIITLLVFMGASTALGFLSPMLTGFLYGTVINEPVDSAMQLLISTGIFYIALNISLLLFNQFRSLVEEKIGDKANMYLEAAVISRILLLPPSFFRKCSGGELQSRAGYVSSLASSLFSAIFNTGFTALFSLAYIGSMMTYAKTLVVPALLISLASIGFSLVFTLSTMKISKANMEAASRHNALKFQLISGLQKIKLAGAEKRAFSKWSRSHSVVARYSYNPPGIMKVNTMIGLALSYLGTLVMYWFAVKSNVSIAEYNAFNVSYGMVNGAFSSISSIALTIAAIKPTLDMAKPILDAEPETGAGKEQVTSLQGDIELNHVSFRYDDHQTDVLRDFSLRIKAGEYIAVVGKTGCGKSTLVKLLLGFEKPRKGGIYYDSRNIDSLDLQSLRRHIGTVMQDGQLFQGDIYSNITISAPWLTMEDAWEAAEIAGIAQDIKSMPMGMHTLLGENSGGISGGQKQRLMIARAVAGKPGIVILDEATSALDNITQKHVTEALDSLKCTRIVIAHRLSTIRNCDRIIYMEDGTVAESGTYDELIALNGRFAALVERQRLSD